MCKICRSFRVYPAKAKTLFAKYSEVAEPINHELLHSILINFVRSPNYLLAQIVTFSHRRYSAMFAYGRLSTSLGLIPLKL